MQIYKDELPLKEKILASKKVKTIASTISKKNVSEETAKIAKDIATKAFASMGLEHPELMYGSAILVSTCMNHNDDIFLPEETWKAKDTPINTPYNEEHDEKSIIGHIIASRCLAADGSEIVSDTHPDYFDIEVDFVLYKEIFPDIATNIAKKGPEKKQFVSMECILSGFDYGLIDASNNLTIVKRNKDTAFLTKYLRVYNGSGMYKEYRIGRVLRDFVFSGMGNVETPANPASSYTKIGNKKIVASIQKEEKSFLLILKGKVMTIETLEQAQKVIDDLTKEKESAEGAKATLEKSKSDLEAAKAALETEKAELENKVKASEDKYQAEVIKVEALESSKKELETQLASANEELKKFREEAEAAKKEKKIAERKEQMVKCGLKYEGEKLEKILNLSDEAFASLIEFADEVNKTKATDKTEDNKVEEATKDVEEAKASTDNTEDETKGDEGAEDEHNIEKVAASLIECLRNRNKPKQNNKKD